MKVKESVHVLVHVYYFALSLGFCIVEFHVLFSLRDHHLGLAFNYLHVCTCKCDCECVREGASECECVRE